MSTTPAPKGRTLGLALAAGFALAAVAAIFVLRGTGPTPPLPAPGVAEPVDAAGLRNEGYFVITAVLETIYTAFAETDEATIYDRLAQVAAGDALEALYLERAGALASGGLPDQVVHELQLSEARWRLDGDALIADAKWAVLGEVGHAEHTHMRGNAYAAELTLTPSEDAWRLTGFTLTDVDRTEAGTLTTPEGTDATEAPPG